MAQWNKNTVPKCKNKNCSDEVLVTVEHIGYGGKLYRRVIKAVYFPYHHCTIDDMAWNMDDGIPNDWEYSDEDDSVNTVEVIGNIFDNPELLESEEK